MRSFRTVAFWGGLLLVDGVVAALFGKTTAGIVTLFAGVLLCGLLFASVFHEDQETRYRGLFDERDGDGDSDR